MKHQRSCSKYLPECLCFGEFPERHFELGAKLQTEKLPSDLQNAEYLFVADFQFREKFLLLLLKCDLLIGGQDRAYSFRNARNHEDAAQRLQRFVHWEVLALNVHGLRHRSKPYRFPPGW
jgi:hypothetical protein